MRLAGLLLLAMSTTLWSQSGIVNIKEFLKTCPNNDPAIATIRADFEIRNSGNVVTNIACTEPYNQMNPTALTAELVMLQSLRVMYYMDQGRSNYLPWTPLRLYDWVKSKVGGLNIVTTTGSSCCQQFNGKNFITIGALDQLSLTGYQTFSGISGGIGLLGHEARHIDGFPHVSCCSVGPGACDQTYDEKNISPYAMRTIWHERGSPARSTWVSTASIRTKSGRRTSSFSARRRADRTGSAILSLRRVRCSNYPTRRAARVLCGRSPWPRTH